MSLFAYFNGRMSRSIHASFSHQSHQRSHCRSHSRFYCYSARLAMLAVAVSLGLTACSSKPSSSQSSSSQPDSTAAQVSDDNLKTDDLYIVDCLLPGQVRQLGSTSYLSPRRPVRTTAIDCRIRGGEYVDYDRSDYRTALKVWLPQAEQGDAEAQTYVGEIFERGVGSTPDYVAAATWYQKAADQGFTRGQINLGYLYEKGLGVDKNIATALNLYRQASGLANDQLVYESSANKALEELRGELTEKIASAEQQTAVLSGQITNLEAQRKKLLATEERLQAELQAANSEEQRQKIEEAQTELALAKREIDVLTQLYTRAESEREDLRSELDALPTIAFRNVETPPILEPIKLGAASPSEFQDINFGRYFALIIGNQDYMYMEDLRSSYRDASQLKEVLEERYGFSTILLQDADEKSILNALNDLYDQLGPKDNLLIYYAGHGNLTQSTNSKLERGYWLPIDAQADRFANWISNTVISDHLDRLRARSVLVLSDSCYAGNMASDKSPFLLGSVNTALSSDSIKLGLERRSRLVISSGGVKPVLDGTSGQHSLFTGSLIEILRDNNEVLRDNMLFARLAVNVRHRNQVTNQTPELRPIRAAGHSGGDFYFVPQQTMSSSTSQASESMLIVSRH